MPGPPYNSHGCLGGFVWVPLTVSMGNCMGILTSLTIWPQKILRAGLDGRKIRNIVLDRNAESTGPRINVPACRYLRASVPVFRIIIILTAVSATVQNVLA